MESVCAVCGAKAPHRCGSCQSVSYCSVEHQKEGWKVHRKICPYFKIVEDSVLGKGFIATRDIKPGTVILDEKPVVACPFMCKDQLCCLTCGLVEEKWQHSMRGRRCTRCKLPVCSLECERHPVHAENECPIFAYCPPPTLDFLYTDLVMGIRVCLLKRNDPQMYQQILELCSEFSLLPGDFPQAFVSVFKWLLKEVQGLELDTEDITKLLRIFILNCYMGPGPEGITRDNLGLTRYIKGLYIQASRINHSCIPNCDWIITPNSEYQIRIQTTRAVKKGEPLTHFYWKRIIEKPTPPRHEFIQREGYFRCECARCRDPTELGTYISGVVCKTCRRRNTKGYFLPEDPLNVEPDAQWKCSCCQKIKLANEILPIVEELHQRISEAAIRFPRKPFDERLIHFCKSLVKEISGITLHPNHWIIKDAMEISVGYFLNPGHTTGSLELSEYFVKCGKYVLSILDLLTPGITYSRVAVQYQLSGALYYQQEYRDFQQFELSKSEECEMFLREALKFFENRYSLTEGVVSSATSKIKGTITHVLVQRSNYLSHVMLAGLRK